MIREIKCSSVAEFLGYLTPWGSGGFTEGCIYRGHADSNYKLLPSALRLENERRLSAIAPGRININGRGSRVEFEQAYFEYGVIRGFYRLADARGLSVPISDYLRRQIYQSVDILTLFKWEDNQKWLPDSLVEAAALAQHYGVPTRLLDWTYDPFVAAFFASATQPSGAESLCIWAMNVEDPRIAHFIFGDDSDVKIIHPPYAGNPNLAAQRGVFTHISRPLSDINKTTKDVQDGKGSLVDRTTLDEYVQNKFGVFQESGIEIFKKITLPASKSMELHEMLWKFGYGPSRIFAGYGGVADEVIGAEKFNS